MSRNELDEFKRIDLRCYAASQGYVEDYRRRYKTSFCMRNPATGDKIYIKLDIDGHYLYSSMKNNDSGSIIDFVAHHKRLNLKVRESWKTIGQELRPWLGKPPVSVPSFPPLAKARVEKDRMKVETAYARMDDATTGHPYLERERAIPRALLALERFAGRISIDARGNAVFPHFDANGLSGYELKNTGFTGFASGGTKALWLSHEFPDDKRLVICEAAIDALSHAVIYPDNHARYASIGGKPNDQQPELVRAAVARMPLDSEIISAMDNDADGVKLTEVVRRAVQLSGRQDLRFVVMLPVGAKDFNDQLKARPNPLLPYRPPEVPSVA